TGGATGSSSAPRSQGPDRSCRPSRPGSAVLRPPAASRSPAPGCSPSVPSRAPSKAQNSRISNSQPGSAFMEQTSYSARIDGYTVGSPNPEGDHMRPRLPVLAWLLIALMADSTTVSAQQSGRIYKIGWLQYGYGEAGRELPPFEEWTGTGIRAAF